MSPKVEPAKFDVTLTELNGDSELTYVIGKAFKPMMDLNANVTGQVYLIVDGEILDSGWNFDEGMPYELKSYPQDVQDTNYPNGTPLLKLEDNYGGYKLKTNKVYLDESYSGKTANFRVYANGDSVDLPEFVLIARSATPEECNSSVSAMLDVLPAYQIADLYSEFNVSSSFKISTVEMRNQNTGFGLLSEQQQKYICNGTCGVSFGVDSIITLKTTLVGCPAPVIKTIDVSSIDHDQFDVQINNTSAEVSTSFFPVGVSPSQVNIRMFMVHNQNSRMTLKVWRKSEYPLGQPIANEIINYTVSTYNDMPYNTLYKNIDLMFTQQTETLVYDVIDGFGQRASGELTVTHNMHSSVASSGGYKLNPERVMTPVWNSPLKEHNFETAFNLTLRFNPTDYWMYQCAVLIDGKSVWDYFPGYNGVKGCNRNTNGGYIMAEILMNIPYVPEEWVGKTAQIYVRARPRINYNYEYFIYETPLVIKQESESDWSLNPCNWKDTDSDGMPDGWEYKVGLNPNTNDANDDRDQNNEININEYIRTYQSIALCTP